MSKEISFSLSGGGLSSVAYLGFFDELKKHKIVPKQLAGLSGGAFVSVFLAAGLSSEEIIDFLSEIQFHKILNFSLHGLEIIDHRKLVEITRSYLPVKDFEELNIPVKIFTTDLVNKQPIVIDSGDIASAIAASSSMFPFMQPIKRNGLVLGDGGYTTYYGAQYLRNKKSDIVIGVDVAGLTERTVGGFFNQLFRQINSALTSNAQYELEQHPVDLDVQIYFPMPNFFNIGASSKKMLKAGEKVAQNNLRKIQNLVKK